MKSSDAATSRSDVAFGPLSAQVVEAVEPHYRPARACELAGISLVTFWRRVRDGSIKVKRPSSGVVVVAASELNRFLGR